ncbi:MAG: Ig-like domain-containing protein [Armatimonadetes bacterium]|nr:Ig-like domain-containing protein [Armatimonadota bacterium]
MIVVVIFLLAFSAQVFATPSVSVTKDYPVLWVNGPIAQTTPIIATVADNGSPLSGVTVSFSTTKGSISPSSAQTGSDGKAATTLSTSGSSTSGTATITASVTINGQPYSGTTTVKFTFGSWNKIFSGTGSGSVSWTVISGSVEAWVEGHLLIYSGQTIACETEVGIKATLSGSNVQANGSGQSQLNYSLTWVGNPNNTNSPPPSRLKIKESYTASRELAMQPGTGGMNPSGSARAQAQTQGSDQIQPDIHSIVFNVGSGSTETGTDGPDVHVILNGYIDSSSGEIDDSFVTLSSAIAPYINTIRQSIVEDTSTGLISGNASVLG